MFRFYMISAEFQYKILKFTHLAQQSLYYNIEKDVNAVLKRCHRSA